MFFGTGGGRRMLKTINFWTPFLGMGIRVSKIASDFRTFEVEMPLRFYNRNYVGTQWGGALYAMCDPFFMLILIENLGPDYVVWDKAATIRFKRPGRGKVRAVFHIPEEKIDELRARADAGEKVEPTFTVEVKSIDGEVVAEVDKLLYIRRKKPDAPRT